MQKQLAKIAIIGDDKLAKTLIRGLLRAEFSGKNIVVITQQRSLSDSFFETNVLVSIELQKVASCEYILLTGEPRSSGDILPF